MMGSVGWLCPKCNTVHAPWESTCAKCSGTKLSFGTISFTGTMGAISIGNNPWFAPHTPPAPEPDPNEVRADKVIKSWRAGKGGWDELRTLIAETIEEAVDEACEEDE